jgi:hypothetical protein
MPLGCVRWIVDGELDDAGGPVRRGPSKPQGVDKTAAATRRVTTVLDLSCSPVCQLAEADPGCIAAAPGPVLADERQAYPESWEEVRRFVDCGREPGPFLLAGSVYVIQKVLLSPLMSEPSISPGGASSFGCASMQRCQPRSVPRPAGHGRHRRTHS